MPGRLIKKTVYEYDYPEDVSSDDSEDSEYIDESEERSSEGEPSDADTLPSES
jgi:hypothetical protein